MKRTAIIALGFALAFVGALRILTYQDPKGPFAAYGCLTGDAGALSFGGLDPIFVHCWGCYAAALGGVLVIAGALLHRSAPKLSRRDL